VDPANSTAAEHRSQVERLRALDRPSLPSTMGLEMQINPFLRCNESTVVKAAELHAGKSLKETAAVFGVLRAWKDQFR
jgi:hydroxyacylglutathione hydrolase